MKALSWQMAVTLVLTIATAWWLELPAGAEVVVVGLIIFGAVSGITALIGRTRSGSVPPQGDAHG
jgi:hypothetical protein